MSVVSSLNTGRMGFTARFHRDSPLWDAEVTWSNPTGPQSWTLSRRAALYLSAIEIGSDDAQAARMAVSGMVIWANESGWGGHEYRWNGWGCHPFEGADEMHFTAGDPALAAFATIEASAKKFWLVAMQDGAVANAFKAGDPLAAVALTRTAFGGGNVMPDADARSIYARIQMYMATTETPAGDGPPAAPARRASSGSSTGAKWLVAAAVLAAIAASGNKE